MILSEERIPGSKLISRLLMGTGFRHTNFTVRRYPRFEDHAVSEFLSMPGTVYVRDKGDAHHYSIKKTCKMSDAPGMSQLHDLSLRIRSGPLPFWASPAIPKRPPSRKGVDFSAGSLRVELRVHSETGEHMMVQKFRGFERDLCPNLALSPLFVHVRDLVNACSFDVRGTIFE